MLTASVQRPLATTRGGRYNLDTYEGKTERKLGGGRRFPPPVSPSYRQSYPIRGSVDMAR
jgi:hypothetical protein